MKKNKNMESNSDDIKKQNTSNKNKEMNKKDEEVERIKKEEKLENSKKNKIIVAIIIVALIGLLVFLYILSNNKHKNQDKDDFYDDKSYITADSDSIFFSCSNTSPEIKEKSGDVKVYGIYDYVYCNMGFSADNYNKMTYLEFEYNYGGNIEFSEIYSLDDGWQVDRTLGKIEIRLKDDNSNISSVYFKFYIKNNNNVKNAYEIMLKNIKFTADNKDYKIEKNKIIKLMKAGNERTLKYGDVLVFQKLSSDNGFKTISEYKCSNKESCYVSGASLFFEYKNNNKNIIMIGDDKYNVLYDKKEGNVIGTYGRIPSWMTSKDVSAPYCHSYYSGSGKYIYIQSKDTDKYGIIDVDGNVIKDFTLEKLPQESYPGYLNILRYLVEENMIVDIKNGKYGIIEITSDKVIIDYIYDDIYLLSHGYFKAKINDKWSIYDISTGEKVIHEEFDDIHYNSNNILIVEKDNTLYIRNYENKNIIEDTIKVKDGYVAITSCPFTYYNEIYIDICDDKACYNFAEGYIYNVSSNKLNKK